MPIITLGWSTTPATNTVPTTVLTDNSWIQATEQLRDPDCCVVSIGGGMEKPLQVLQEAMMQELVDVDLRHRIRAKNRRQDCQNLMQQLEMGRSAEMDDSSSVSNPVVSALEEIAQGAAQLLGQDQDIFFRIVAASNYHAKDPMFHTDKCPLRVYVTLSGVLSLIHI